ncbi:hypothetical protein CRENBAI_005715, partial [Crenichthys baileyi]
MTVCAGDVVSASTGRAHQCPGVLGCDFGAAPLPPRFTGEHVLVRSNTTVVFTINHQGGIQSPVLLRLTRQLLLWALPRFASLESGGCIPKLLQLSHASSPEEGPSVSARGFGSCTLIPVTCSEWNLGLAAAGPSIAAKRYGGRVGHAPYNEHCQSSLHTSAVCLSSCNGRALSKQRLSCWVFDVVEQAYVLQGA